MSTDNVKSISAAGRAKLVVENSFEANPDAKTAYELVSAALARADTNHMKIAYVSVGVRGAAEKLREAAELIQRAGSILQTLADSQEENARFRAWSSLHDT